MPLATYLPLISHSMVVATYLPLNAASDISPNQCLSEVLCTVPLLLCWLSSLEVSFAVSRALSNCVHAWSTLNFDYIYIYIYHIRMYVVYMTYIRMSCFRLYMHSTPTMYGHMSLNTNIYIYIYIYINHDNAVIDYHWWGLRRLCTPQLI